MSFFGCLRHRSLIFAALLVAHSVAASSEALEIKTGFITGNDYRDFSVREQRIYAIGLIDGMLLGPFFGAEKQSLGWLERCATNMNDEQVAAIFGKYLEENPTRWHQSMHTLGWFAMKEACEA